MTRKRTLLSDRKHLTDSRSLSKISRKSFGGISISYNHLFTLFWRPGGTGQVPRIPSQILVEEPCATVIIIYDYSFGIEGHILSCTEYWSSLE